MEYRFGNYKVNCSIDEHEVIADIFRDMFLSVVGTTDEELKEALEREGFEVEKIEEE